MRGDVLACLTGEIRDEVMERYITERRLIELQIEGIREHAEGVQDYAVEAGRRLNRLAYWMIQSQTREKLRMLLNISESSPWKRYLEAGFPYEVHSIQLHALRDKTRLNKVLGKAYNRMVEWMGRYGARYEDLKAECEAVNSNIKRFQSNSELLTVLSFLKGLDPCTTEKSHFLGGNFTSRELAHVEEALRFRPVALESLGVPAPLTFLESKQMESALSELAQDVFEHSRKEIRRLIQAIGPKGY